MDADKKKRLEAKGWKVGDFQSFLGLSDAEASLVRMRLNAADALKARRLAAGMTQSEFAKQIGSSQARVAKLECGEPPSLDRLVKALLDAGATPEEAVMSLLETS